MKNDLLVVGLAVAFAGIKSKSHVQRSKARGLEIVVNFSVLFRHTPILAENTFGGQAGKKSATSIKEPSNIK
jgi:hypothetical protein